MDEQAAAESLVRRFARDTNLLIAGRPARVRPAAREDAVAAALERMLRRLGALVGDDAGAPEERVEYVLDAAPGEPAILLGGAPLPHRGDASARIAFAGERMRVSRQVAAGLDLSGLRVGIAMVLEPKTAQLALLLRDAGAEVSVYAHPDETDPEIAEALRTRGVPVEAERGKSGEAERDAALGFLRRGHDVLLDDGSHLIRLAHEAVPDVARAWIGANEETTSGLTPLRLLAARGGLLASVVAVNDAATKVFFDNRYGTGQSCVFAIADVLEPAGIGVRDQPAIVVGYGPVGQGVAAHLAALGAEVRVAETDPVRALQALHDGYRVGPAAELARGALVVSATGAPRTLDAAIVAGARVLAVAGGVPGELDPAAVAGRGWAAVRVDGAPLPHLERLGAGGPLVVDRGGCVNLTAGEGNPIEIMDLSFAAQLAGVGFLLSERPGPGIHPLPPRFDDRVARAALAERGIRIDARSAAQRAAEERWESPRYRRATDAERSTR